MTRMRDKPNNISDMLNNEGVQTEGVVEKLEYISGRYEEFKKRLPDQHSLDTVLDSLREDNTRLAPERVRHLAEYCDLKQLHYNSKPRKTG